MAKNHRFDEKTFLVEPGGNLQLAERSTRAGDELEGKPHGAATLEADVESLREAQRRLYATSSHSLLVIFQGIDASGKDGTVRHVMGEVNPQGCRVFSFRAPNQSELQHHFLCRAIPCLPARGMISLFNRSYYEEVLVVRVHPEFLIPQKLPGLEIRDEQSLEKLWTQRYQEINSMERALARNGTQILKFFLHISPEEQKQRFLKRLRNPEKHWKFDAQDLAERKLWTKYQRAFEGALSSTSTAEAPWYVIPADQKWYSRAVVADIIAAKLERLDLGFPLVSPEQRAVFDDFAQQLENE